MAHSKKEEDRDITLGVVFATYGTAEQRLNTAAEVKRLLEVRLQKEVEVAIKIGNEWQPVERQDRNASVE